MNAPSPSSFSIFFVDCLDSGIICYDNIGPVALKIIQLPCLAGAV